MAAGVAHELNNPLTTIQLMSQLLLEDDVPEAVKDEVLLISKEAKRGEGAGIIVKNLLTFSRKHDTAKQATKVNHVIDDVLTLRSYEHKIHNIEIERKLDPDMPDVMADYFQIQQVFLNVILNAEQAMIEASGSGNLTVRSQHQDECVHISFADNGPGIAEEHRDKIFDPMFTTKEVGEGTGMGLSICYGIVRNHMGKIYAESEVGKGTTFTIELPIFNKEREGIPV